VSAAQARSIHAHRRVIETAVHALELHELAALAQEERASSLRAANSAPDLVRAAQTSAARERELALQAERLVARHREALSREYGITVTADRDGRRAEDSPLRAVASDERVRSDTREHTHTYTSAEDFEETLSLLRRVHPSNDPSLEDIARFHELHAAHERKAGRIRNAEAAEERARQTRMRSEARDRRVDQSTPPPDPPAGSTKD
jgi:hypothetical protein